MKMIQDVIFFPKKIANRPQSLGSRGTWRWGGDIFSWAQALVVKGHFKSALGTSTLRHVLHMGWYSQAHVVQ